jgi:lipopolysaccharide export system ATP-binding protein
MRTLATEELTKAYGGRQVVRGVSLHIRQGEVVGLLGPNGAGKTTTFYMTVGLVRPDSGRILTDDSDITRTPMYRRAREFGISYLPQEPSVFRKLTVEENIMAVLETLQVSWETRRKRAESLIVQLNLGHVRRTQGYALSGGERRRVEIARCLAIDPAFILLDEPFSGIDPIAVLELQKIILDLKNAGIGVLITDHNVPETLAVTDRAYIISDGRILFAGTPGELGRNPEAFVFAAWNPFAWLPIWNRGEAHAGRNRGGRRIRSTLGPRRPDSRAVRQARARPCGRPCLRW